MSSLSLFSLAHVITLSQRPTQLPQIYSSRLASKNSIEIVFVSDSAFDCSKEVSDDGCLLFLF